MEESRKSSFLASQDKDVSKIQTSMVIKYWMEWFETACIFILDEKDAFHNADLMDSESNFNFSSNLGISIYSIQYLLTTLVCILLTSSSWEAKNEDLQDSFIAKLLKSIEESHKSSFLLSQDEDVNKIRTRMVSKYWMA